LKIQVLTQSPKLRDYGAESEAYESKEGCQKGIAAVKENAAKAVEKDNTA
jgi:hypothetical protein